jgi:hypothetical protein
MTKYELKLSFIIFYSRKQRSSSCFIYIVLVRTVGEPRSQLFTLGEAEPGD